MEVILKVVLMAVIQGITEFLPVSSSGHLVIAGHMLGFREDESVHLAITLHAGSLVSIAAFYWREIWRIVREFDWRMVLLLAVGTVPAVIVGLTLKKTGWDDKLTNVWVASTGLLITAAFLRFLHRPGASGRPLAEMRWVDAIGIGVLQAIAILPGISRSGSTISMATRMGQAREGAATYSFLLGMIAISGAIVLKSKDLFDASSAEGAQLGFGVLALGFVVSAGVGYVALRILIRTLKHGKFALFSYYCMAMAVVGYLAAIFA